MPSVNFTPWISFGNWLWPSIRRAARSPPPVRRHRDADRANAHAPVPAGGGGPLSGHSFVLGDLPDHRPDPADGGISCRSGLRRRRPEVYHETEPLGSVLAHDVPGTAR